MIQYSKRVALVSGLVVATMLMAGGAQAAPSLLTLSATDDGAPSVRVNYGDLNLSRTADAKELLSRVNTAARQVCGEPDSSLSGMIAINKCAKGLSAKAVSDVNSPAVTALFTGRAAEDRLASIR